MQKSICLNSSCSTEFYFRPTNSSGKYCSKSCAAQVNNKNNPKRTILAKNLCNNCGKKKYGKTAYCGKCIPIVRLQQWLNDEIIPVKEKCVPTWIRTFLLEECNYSCQECGFNTPHPDDGQTILEIDHIDGNGRNHKRNNLRVLCPNHHALTSTYRARNKTTSRNYYYKRVTKIVSV